VTSDNEYMITQFNSRHKRCSPVSFARSSYKEANRVRDDSHPARPDVRRKDPHAPLLSRRWHPRPIGGASPSRSHSRAGPVCRTWRGYRFGFLHYRYRTPRRGVTDDRLDVTLMQRGYSREEIIDPMVGLTCIWQTNVACHRP
jgi:hypothetical protein